MTVERFGGLDVLVNNAGGGTGGPIADSEMSEYARIVAVNQTGVWLGVRAAMRVMRERGGGSIVNIASTAAAIGRPGSGAYCAAKWAVRGITRTAALEGAEHGIRANAVLPGLIRTPIYDDFPALAGIDEILRSERRIMGMTVPMGRRGEPIEVSAVVVFLASDDSSYISGVEFPVDGGMLAGALPSGIWETHARSGALDASMAG